MTESIWAYKGMYPNDITSTPFWGYYGIMPLSDNVFPSGIVTADKTEIIPPDTATLTCIAVNTYSYAWEKSRDGVNWTRLLGVSGSEIDVTFTASDEGDNYFRCLCLGWAGNRYTAPVTISVTALMVLGRGILGHSVLG